jgi:hypothetical protein
MIKLLHTAADRTFPNGHKNTVGLGELGVVQAIKQIINVNLEWAVLWTRLSHAFFEYSETPPTRVPQSLRWSAHCFSRTSAATALFPQGA